MINGRRIDRRGIDGRVVSASTIVRAPAVALFELLADPSRHAAIDGSGTGSVRRLVRGPDRLFLGARFVMSMHLGVPYTVVNRVVEFEEGRLLAWSHLSGAVWRYQLESVGSGSADPGSVDEAATRVTETFDLRPSWLAGLYERTSVAPFNERGIARSLALLKDVVEHERQRQT